MEIEALMTVAAPQHGCITWAQALSIMNRGRFEHLVDKGIVKSVYPSTYAVAGLERTWKQKAMALALSVPGSAVSHHAAAKLLGLTFGESNALELTAPGKKLPVRDGATIRRSGQLAPFITTIDGIPATTPERTIVDLSRFMTWRQVGAVIDQARMLKLTTPKDVNACIDAMSTRGVPRISNLRQALEPRLLTDKDMDSFLEKRTLDWMTKHGFPEPETQVWYRKCPTPYRLDIWYAARKINIEPDGPHHLLPSYALSDAKRDAQLGIRGILVIRVPLEMEEHEFVALLRSALIARPLSPQ